MSITVSGLGSGLNYDSWISELVAIKQADIDEVSSKVKSIGKQESALNTIESDYKKFLTAIQTFTDALSTTDVFNQKTATSSNSEAVSASVTSGANVQNVKVSVSQLATSTEAESSYSVASKVTGSTKLNELSGGTFKEGTFSLYVDGVKKTINIDDDTKDLDSVLSQLNSITNADGEVAVSATMDNGKLSIKATEASGSTISVGSSSDTSNFSNVMSLALTTTPTTSYTSSKTLFDTDEDANITSTSFSDKNGNDVSVRTGTFTIGSTQFTIDANTSIDDVVDKINESDCGATAAWDANTGKFILRAEDEGAVNINVEAGTSNFTDVMGLTESTWTTTVNGETTTYAKDTTRLVDGSQNLGTNAILSINGTTITSSSNTVTSDISGIKGLTLTLNTTTAATTTISVTQDTSKISDALTSVVNAYNTVIADTDSATATDGQLYGETLLTSIRNNVRKIITSAVSGNGSYNTLASIGISTGAIGTSTTANTNKLTIDTEKLTAALNADPDAVKKLLLGDDNSTDKTKKSGILDKLETVVNNATDAVDGYFVTREGSYEKQVDRLNDKIERMQDNLEKYQKNLEDKFSAMDKLISSLQKSASLFDSYFNKDNSKDS